MDSFFSFIDSLVASGHLCHLCDHKRLVWQCVAMCGAHCKAGVRQWFTHAEILKNGQEWVVLFSGNGSIHGSLQTRGMDQAIIGYLNLNIFQHLPMIQHCSCASSQSSSGVVTSTWPSSMVCTCKLFGYCLVCWRLGQRLQLAKIRSSWFLICTCSNKFCYFPDSLQCYDTRTREDIPNTNSY